jgi:hypothetical protein
VPKLIVDNPRFRIVEDIVGGNEIHCLEVPDGADALGVERWRTYHTNTASLRAMFDFMIVMAKKGTDG